MNVTKQTKMFAEPAKKEHSYTKEDVEKDAMKDIELTEYHGPAWKHLFSLGTGYILPQAPAAHTVVKLSVQIQIVHAVITVSTLEIAAKTLKTIAPNYCSGESRVSNQRDLEVA